MSVVVAVPLSAPCLSKIVFDDVPDFLTPKLPVIFGNPAEI